MSPATPTLREVLLDVMFRAAPFARGQGLRADRARLRSALENALKTVRAYDATADQAASDAPARLDTRDPYALIEAFLQTGGELAELESAIGDRKIYQSTMRMAGE